ncbi:MAG TPA: hypothetical protein VJR89_27420, partial [Polyangiales bacterium]|nr:hypothetical protein [Polyangiales bacterium]
KPDTQSNLRNIIFASLSNRARCKLAAPFRDPSGSLAHDRLHSVRKCLHQAGSELAKERDQGRTIDLYWHCRPGTPIK